MKEETSRASSAIIHFCIHLSRDLVSSWVPSSKRSKNTSPFTKAVSGFWVSSQVCLVTILDVWPRFCDRFATVHGWSYARFNRTIPRRREGRVSWVSAELELRWKYWKALRYQCRPDKECEGEALILHLEDNSIWSEAMIHHSETMWHAKIIAFRRYKWRNVFDQFDQS